MSPHYMIVATCVAHPTRMLTLPLVSVVTEAHVRSQSCMPHGHLRGIERARRSRGWAPNHLVILVSQEK